MASDGVETTGAPPLHGFGRAAAWTAHLAVTRWPFSVEQHGVGRIYWALLPWAGAWAYAPNGGGH